jgi:D-alanine-D-alanine ligase
MVDQSSLSQKRIAVLMGGESAEREISLLTGENVLRVLLDNGYDAHAFDVTPDLSANLIQQKIDLVYIALHGKYGEDGCIQGLLEILKIPYTGSGVLASALAMNKVMTKRVLASLKLPTPEWRYPATFERVKELGFPLVIKPHSEGSSVGLTILENGTDVTLREAITRAGGADCAFAERYIPGRELSVAVLGRGDAAKALGTVEIRPAGKGIYDYEAKYKRNDTQYSIPAPLPAGISERCKALAVSVHQLFHCRGVSRIDLRWNESDSPTLLEVNTLPGMTATSLVPKIAAHEGISYLDLVRQILAEAALGV